MARQHQNLIPIVCVNFLVFMGLVVAIEAAATVAFVLKDTEELWLLPDTIDVPYLYFSFRSSADPRRPVNQDGMATEYGREKPLGTYRVVLLGGSVARSSSSSSKETTIAAILEKLLRERFATQKIEVINAGMSAYVLEQDYIFLQLYLSKYHPDLIVGLDGYNDLMAVRLNRFNGGVIGPQNYPQFQVIQDGKARKRLIGRVSAMLPNTTRALRFVKRVMMQQSNPGYGTLDGAYAERAAAQYRDLLEDLRGLAIHLGARYVAFLQPIRWYNLAEPTKPSGAVPELVRLYQAYEEAIRTVPEAYSLTSLLLQRDDLYVDSMVHVGDKGNELFARAILERVVPLVQTSITSPDD